MRDRIRYWPSSVGRGRTLLVDDIRVSFKSEGEVIEMIDVLD